MNRNNYIFLGFAIIIFLLLGLQPEKKIWVIKGYRLLCEKQFVYLCLKEELQSAELVYIEIDKQKDRVTTWGGIGIWRWENCDIGNKKNWVCSKGNIGSKDEYLISVNGDLYYTILFDTPREKGQFLIYTTFKEYWTAKIKVWIK